MKKRSLSIILAVVILLGIFPLTAMANGDVASVTTGSTTVTYDNITDAVNEWVKAPSTLTLLSDATLTDTVVLKSNEHHILNLGTYTLTAASGKNAIEITPEGVGTSARSCLTINADATNPGGITATGKACIYYKKTNGINDRLMVTINGGVFNGSYTINSSSNNGGQACPYYVFNGGTYNAYINLTKAMMLITGGTFNCSINCTGDSTAHRVISGGTFKSLQFMTSGSGKFTIGSSKNTYDKGAYVNNDGWLVVGGAPITQPGTEFEASVNNSSKFYLQYSSAKDIVFYTSAERALKDNTSATVTVYVDEVDLTGINFTGTINLPNEDSVLKITYAEGTTPKWKVGSNVENLGSDYVETAENGVVTRTYGLKPAYTVKHYQQNADLSGYTLKETEVLGADLGSATKACAKTYTGFAAKSFEQGVVTENGATTVDIYYDRTPLDITYVDNVENEVVFEDTVKVGAYGAYAPAFGDDPVRTGYTFTGWYTNAACSTKLSSTKTFTAPATIYAGWAINSYTVTYMIDGEVVSTQTVEYGNDAVAPEIPEIKGYTAKWSDDGKAVSKDLEINAIYTQNEPGEIKDITPETNFGGGKLTEEETELQKKIPFTEEEKQEIMYGSDANIWVEIKDISETVSKEEKDLVEAATEGTGKLYLDIDVFVKVGQNDAKQITELKEAAEITLALPDEYINTDKNVIRTYSVVYIHNGKTTIIPAVYNEADKTISFATNEFSTYAVTYKDEAVKVEAPKTSDNTRLQLWIALAAVSMALICTTSVLKKKTYQ